MATLRALECLVTVADTGSVTRAARLLHLSQPAVSHQLAALEGETRTALLRREPRGVTLTAAGRAAVADARRAVDAAASAVRSARAAGRASGGSLRIACAQSLVSVLAPVLHDWHVHHPDVALALRESTAPDELHRLLDADEVDVLLRDAPAPDRFTSTVVADEEVVLAAANDHPLAQQRVVRLQDLDGVGLVHYAQDNGLSTWLDWHLATAGVRPEPVIRTSTSTSAPALAAAGLGVAVCPTSALGDGFTGAARSFSPRWVRQLVAVTRTAPDPLVARFTDDLRVHGVPMPPGVQAQLADDEPATGKTRGWPGRRS